jgi:superfamily II DNA or RNA helicase
MLRTAAPHLTRARPRLRFVGDSTRLRGVTAARNSMSLSFDQSDLVTQLGAAEVRKGLDVLNEKLVRRIEVSSDGTRISGSVAGSRPQPYGQTIMLTPRGRRVSIKGYCTCPVGYNCKHVAAALLHRLESVGDLSQASRTFPGSAQRSRAQRPAAAPRATLSPTVSDWLDRLVAPAPEVAASRNQNQRSLRYVLNHHEALLSHTVAEVLVRPVAVRLRNDGTIADEKPYDPENITRPKEQRARFLTDTDFKLLRDLLWIKRANERIGESDIDLAGDATGHALLQSLLESGYLRLGRSDGPVLGTGPAVRADLRWINVAQGGQKLAFVPASGSVAFDCVLPLRPVHYLDRAKCQIGVIEMALPPSTAFEVARAPVVAASEAAIVKGLLQQGLGKTQVSPAKSGAGVVLPLPEASDDVEMRSIVPSPRLELIVTSATLNRGAWWYVSDKRYRGTFPLPLARLSFDYAGEIVPSSFAGKMLEGVEGEKLVLTPRDFAVETRAKQRLAKLGARTLAELPFEVPSDHAGDFFVGETAGGIQDTVEGLDDPGPFAAFSLEAVRQLVAEGWKVVFAEDYPYRFAEGDVQWWADIGDGSGIDWFSFELGIEYEGHRIDLVASLASILAQLTDDLLDLAAAPGAQREFAERCGGLRLWHRLPDGRLLPLPGERLAPMLKALMELIGPRGERLAEGKLKLHRAEAAALAAFAAKAGTDVAWAVNARKLIDLGDRLRRRRGLEPVTVPGSFRGALRPYQRDGLAWLDFLRDAGFGGVLADDMGLGKTVQALAFLSREKEAGRLDRPALIICPTSVLPNWQSEAARFAPTLSVLPLRGLERRESFAAISKSDLVLTTYPLLARDHEVLLAQEFHAAILDEAQAIKNPKAAVASLAQRIKARHRMALTGTPLENNLGEVWSLFAFLSPGLLGDEKAFRRIFRIPIEKHGDAHAQAFLSARLKPFMLRRTKEEVAKELPPKTEIIEHVRLEGAQRDLYETVRALMHGKVRDEIARKGIAKSHIVFLDALLKLRQTCCDPRLLHLPQAKGIKGSAKLERLMEMIPELVGEGRRILLFSQFTSMLALIEQELAKLHIPHVILTGDTKDRATPVREFQNGKVPLFLISLKAGGTGLNLTAADTVIHYDPWWNPAVENQATDRAHRIGQDKPVFVYKLIVEEGIETAIELLKTRKAALAAALFEGSAKVPLDLTEADISALFAPLENAGRRRAA